jgi:outer membrane biosynthesis protein TonB
MSEDKIDLDATLKSLRVTHRKLRSIDKNTLKKMEPETPEPETPEPETPKPEAPEPETPEPQTPEPETPEPQTPEPETPEPKIPTPQEEWANNLQRVSVAITKLEAAKLKVLSNEFKSREPELRKAAIKLEADLSQLQDAVQIIRVASKGLKLITNVVQLLG